MQARRSPIETVYVGCKFSTANAPIGISGTGGTTRAGVGPKYRDCNLDDSYAESFRADYALGASRLQSCLYRRPHRTITLLRLEGKLYRGPFLPFLKRIGMC